MKSSLKVWLISIGVAGFVLVGLPGIPFAQELADGGTGTEEAATLEDLEALKKKGAQPRFLVTYFNSQLGSNPRSATAISVVNQSKKTCDIRVDFFKGLVPETTFCEATRMSVEPGQHVDFCSRPLPGSVTSCNATCDPPLNFDEGKAIVNSTKECTDLAVEARVYYSESGSNTALIGISNSNVVKVGSSRFPFFR